MRRGLTLVVLSLACVASPVTPAAAQSSASPTLSHAQFLAELSRLSGLVGAADNAAAAGEIAATVPERWRVTLQDQEIDVDARWLTAALGQAARGKDHWQRTRAAALQRLALIQQESSAAASTIRSQSDARATLTTILHGDEFQQSAASRWRERLQQRVGRWLEDLWARLGGGSGAGRNAALVLAWTAALGALIGLVVLLARSVADRPRHAVLSLAGRTAIHPRARELALQALEAARAGNGREAVRWGYRSALARLEEQGAWRVDDTRTPREYLPLLRANDSRRTLLFDLTRRFERIWYGNRPVEPDDASRVTAQLEELGCLRPGERAI